MDDLYVDLIQQHWPHISALYNEHAEQRPVMLFDVQEGDLHAFPYDEFLTLLDAPSREALADQYARASASRHMVLFVRDVENRVFQSYSLALED